MSSGGRKFYMVQKTDETIALMEAASAELVGRVNRRILSYTDTIRGALRFVAANYDFISQANPNWADQEAVLADKLAPYLEELEEMQQDDEDGSGKKFYMVEKTPETVALVEAVGELLFGKTNLPDASYTQIIRAALRFLILNFTVAAKDNPGWINDEAKVQDVIAPYLPNERSGHPAAYLAARRPA